jgi:membrane peptidoglycan carboxypeptidase
MSMAAAYATPAANGVYCKPIVLTKIIDNTGKSLPVPSAGCHQAIPVRVAQAVNYILQGVFTGNGATAAGQGLANYPAAGKTGTSNVENGPGTPYAAFAGYTTKLAGYVSVFNPVSPTVKDTMYYTSACYRSWYGYQDCPGEMFGANAPLSVWHVTFDNANLSGSTAFDPVPPWSALWEAGDGQTVKLPKCGKGDKNGKNPNDPNAGQCTPSDTASGGPGNGGGQGNGNGGTGNANTFLPIATPSPLRRPGLSPALPGQPAASWRRTSAATLAPSARPATRGVTAFMAFPIPGRPTAPVSATAAATRPASSSSESWAGR